MRDLSPIRADVEAGFIVLGLDDSSDDSETFRLRITDELIDILTAPSSSDVDVAASDEGRKHDDIERPSPTARRIPDDSEIVDVEEVFDEEGTEEPAEATGDIEDAPAPAAPPRRLFSAPAPAAEPEPEPEAPQDAQVDEPEPGEPAAQSEPVIHAVPKAKYVLPPREIQDRIRAGATVEELVEETGMQYKRVEVFAHPVLADRARVAEQAKAAHPHRADGPTKLSLWEVLATAFAARGLDLLDAEWDARRDATGQWIVSVSWIEDGHLTVAEWSFHQDTPTKASTVARNSVAGELMDPGPRNTRGGLSAVSGEATIPLPAVPPTEVEEYEEDQIEGVTFDPDDEDERPRKKTVMPSWEDVLLGVRVRPNDRK